MSLPDALARALALLDSTGRRDLILLAVVVVLTGAASAAMVASVLPFLTLLADPSALESKRWLLATYERLGFTSPDRFRTALGIGAIVVTVIANLLIVLSVYLIAHFSAGQRHSLSKRLFNHYVNQDYGYFLMRHSGDITAKILSQSNEVVNQVFRPGVDLVSSAVSILAILGVLVAINPLIALSALVALGGAYGATLAVSRKKIRRLGRTRAKVVEDRQRVVAETFGTIKTVKLHGLEDYISDLFETPSRRIAQADASMQVASELPRSFVQTIALTSVIVICLLLLTGSDGSAAFADLVPLIGVFGIAGMRMLPELQRLYASLTKLQYGFGAVDRLHMDLIDGMKAGPEQTTAPGEPIRLRRSLELRDVNFRYPNADVPGLTDLSLSIRAGERIGLVGSTGAGKTTLADILLGLLVPDSGAIVVDGQEITPDRQRAWRRSVGYVPQDIHLRDASIAENIAYGVAADQIDLARVRRSAEVARIASFVEDTLPDGYKSTVGERGVRLSGGQRQRLGIARALYQKADLIVLDEATSALDNLTEREIMAAIDGLPGDNTILLIAHRLSTVRTCDRIYMMESGRIVACGTWETLFADNPHFRELAMSGATT